MEGVVIKDDDRIACTWCQNLRPNHQCLAVKHFVIAGLPRRCSHYIPLATEADQRTGRERWPTPITSIT